MLLHHEGHEEHEEEPGRGSTTEHRAVEDSEITAEALFVRAAQLDTHPASGVGILQAKNAFRSHLGGQLSNARFSSLKHAPSGARCVSNKSRSGNTLVCSEPRHVCHVCHVPRADVITG